jgi:hypothetical protein
LANGERGLDVVEDAGLGERVGGCHWWCLLLCGCQRLKRVGNDIKLEKMISNSISCPT